jgi:hypothetical protein
LCTTTTAFSAWAESPFNRCSSVSGAAPPRAQDGLDVEAESLRDLSRGDGENYPVSTIRIRSPGKSVLTSAASARTRSGCGEHDNRAARAENSLEPLEHIEPEHGVLRAAIMDRGLRDFYQYTQYTSATFVGPGICRNDLCV